MQSNKRIFAWASRLSMRYEAMDICSEYLKEKTSSPIDALIRIYNSAFGSSFEDGISPMAHIFTERISAKNPSDCEKYFYGVFYGILEAFFKDLKAIRMIS